tara:strand:+ start:440 stop:1216 length:777 start_codon:yes stop_codon:yes gene_type:complete
MSDWNVNNFASIAQDDMMNNSTNIDQLFYQKNEDINVVKMLELRGEILSLIEGKDEFDCTEKEKEEIQEKGGKEDLKKEITDFMDKIQKYIENFNILQKELEECNETFQKEERLLRKNVSTTDTMIEFIKKIPEDQKDQENIKLIIEQMNVLSKSIMDNQKMKDIREEYLKKRKESEKMIQIIKKLNHLNHVNICPLCFTNPVDHFADPCGHTFCKECIQRHIRRNTEIDLYEVGRNDGSQCCFCRENIKTVRPLYFL